MSVRDKMTKFIYDNGINTSCNKRNIPANDDKIIEPIKLDLINTGIDFVKNQRFVRARFLGSLKHYEYHFNTREEYANWNSKLSEMEFNLGIDLFKQEEALW